MNGIPVRYNAIFGIAIFIGGSLVLATGLLLGKFLLLTVGLINTLAGYGFITQPWFIVFPDRIEIRNLLGMTLRKHKIANLSELEVHNGRVWAKRSNSGFGGLGGWLARRRDIALVGEAIHSTNDTIGR